MNVSKSEAARRWGVVPSAVSKYIERGMPVLPDGRLDWSAVEKWRRQFNEPTRSGSHKARTSAKAARTEASKPVVEMPKTQTDFDRGFIAGWTRARAGLRNHLPGLIATMRPEHIEDRIGVFALVDYFLGAWLDDDRAGKMPEIIWKPFTSGTTPKAARALFEALQADFAECGSDGK